MPLAPAANIPVSRACAWFPGRQGGSITAALYLEEFVGHGVGARGGGGDEGAGVGPADGESEAPAGKKTRWIHMDFMAFNPSSRPGRPEGGEAQGLRALYALLEDMYGPSPASLGGGA